MNVENYHFGNISSTSDFAKELNEDGELTVVTADFQSGGRGRQGKVWQGGFGQNLYFSLAFKHSYFSPYSSPMNYQSASCLAVLNLLRSVTLNHEFCLKYPNDIYTRSDRGEFKKISGVLVEHNYIGSRAESTVIGIGINVNQKDFDTDISDKAYSLSLLGYKLDINKLGLSLEEELLRIFNTNEQETFKNWKVELDIIGKKARINDRQDGEVTGLNADGSLSVLVNGEMVRIDNGDKIRYTLG
jgi:BirA family transcriptional regulator, biotin operon repressor / biotin---[acetyl-CoA-carboxylase] ligase